ncbi:unnamed protein product [Porites lobata]|uniref:G-protein coupled receptors family 1 profile domain-containing protein n=1 Tax=Porites lobata TaxID=104759 RepID=A0ABN8R7F3_9CNID|nr:unnamed protein product [Porites lobata]
MSGDTASIAVLILLAFLSIIVCISNAFTVFVFWVHHSKLKRTSFLVINLAVADLLIGLTDTKLSRTSFLVINLAVADLFAGLTEIIEVAVNESVPPSFQILSSSASVFFLVLISLERAFALIWPLRHRVTSTKVYIYSVVIAWLAGIAIGVSSFIAFLGIYNLKYFAVGAAVIIGFSLITICVSYLSIRKRINSRTPAIDTEHNRISVEQNTKLSKTLFIVIGASVALWVPSLTWYNISVWYPRLFPHFVIHIFAMPHITNSLVNPIIYSLRIPVFKKTIQQVRNKLKVVKRSKSYTFMQNTPRLSLFKLKRTSFLVINLAVADLLIGLTDTVEVGAFALPKHIGSNETITEMKGSIVAPFVASFSCASVFFLVLISLERAFALIWPLRHRVTSRKVYIYSVVIAWLAGIAMGVSSFIAFLGIYNLTYFAVGAAVIIGFSLIAICVSYLSIRKRINNRAPAFDKAHSRICVEQNTKLSKTLFIVIGASVALWVPSLTWYNISVWYPRLFPHFVIHIFTMPLITNSLVNPIIYSLRIPVFKKTIQQVRNKLKVVKRSKSYTFS